MPIVQVSVWEGIKPEESRRGHTKIFVDMEMPADAVTIVIVETPKENWATGGKLHSEVFKNF